MYAFFMTMLAQEFFGKHTGVADSLILKFNFDEFFHKINIYIQQIFWLYLYIVQSRNIPVPLPIAPLDHVHSKEFV